MLTPAQASIFFGDETFKTKTTTRTWRPSGFREASSPRPPGADGQARDCRCKHSAPRLLPPTRRPHYRLLHPLLPRLPLPRNGTDRASSSRPRSASAPSSFYARTHSQTAAAGGRRTARRGTPAAMPAPSRRGARTARQGPASRRAFTGTARESLRGSCLPRPSSPARRRREETTSRTPSNPSSAT